MIIASLAPFFWAVTNHIDKYLLSKYTKGGSVGSLVIFSCFVSVIILPIIIIINPTVLLDVVLSHKLLLIVVGILNTLGVLMYLYALHSDNASAVVPFFQLVPVFGFVFGYLILNEIITRDQMLASVFIIIGATLLSIDLRKKRVKFKRRVVFFMLFSTVAFSLHAVLFKLIAIEESFILAIFWEYIGLLVTGIFFILFIKSYRDQFFNLLHENGSSIFLLNILNESLVLAGNLVTAYALTIAPVALVLSIGGFQPLFVSIIEIFIFAFFPILWIKTGDRSIWYVVYQISAILIIMYGGYLLNIS